jgi:hypothetical protein
MRADEYEPGEGLYNMDTLKVYWKKSDEEEILLYLASPQDYSKELLDEKNLDQEIVETTVTITGLGNYSGKVINIFATGTLGAGDFTDAFGQLDKKPGYTYISYSDEMENMFRISSQGKSAIDELNTQLYNHGYVNESVTINKTMASINKYKALKTSQKYFVKYYLHANIFQMFILRFVYYISLMISYIIYFFNRIFKKKK